MISLETRDSSSSLCRKVLSRCYNGWFIKELKKLLKLSFPIVSHEPLLLIASFPVPLLSLMGETKKKAHNSFNKPGLSIIHT